MHEGSDASNAAHRLPVSRRHLLLAGSASLLAGAGMIPTPLRAVAALGPVPGITVPAAQRPRLRWWWPGGAIDPAEVRREVADMARAGFGGFEIADVRDSVTVPLDPAIFGWGSERWIAGVEAAFDEADKQGLKADITIGAHWPTGMPGVTPDSPAASQELVHGAARLAAGERFVGPPPAPQGPPAGLQPGLKISSPTITPRLIALQAYRMLGEGAGGVVRLDPGSRIDLTGKVRDGQLEWTAPSGGTWQLIAFWARGTGQLQNMFDRNREASMLASPVPYVIDIFGSAGTRACTRYWDDHLLPPRMKALASRIGGSFFEDSLELKACQHWSPDLLHEFSTRRGYDLLDFLPLAVKPAFDPARPAFLPQPAVYEFPEVSRARLLRDFNATLGEMYVANRVVPIGEWAHQYGMKFRVQAIGGIVDSGSAAAIADIPEGDNSCDLDGFRVLAAGASIGGRPILSDEAATFVGGNANVADWRTLLMMVQRDFAGGVNQAVLHGYSYADAPGVTWPGFSAFGRAIGNDWGPRSPLWTMAPDASGYLARLQRFLQTAPTVCDVAILNQSLGTHAHFADPGLANAGYTYQFPTASLLERADASVRDGALFPDGPAYKALVINHEAALSPAVVQRLLGLAKGGFPILVVGTPPERAIGLPAPNDAAIQKGMTALLQFPTTTRVPDEAALSAALSALGITPSLGFSKPDGMVGLTRRKGGTLFVYLLNDGTVPLRQKISIASTARAYQLDAWTGETRPCANYRQIEGRTEIDLDFPVDGAITLLFTDELVAGIRAPALHASDPAIEAAYIDDTLMLVARETGSHEVRLSDGRVARAIVDAVPPPLALTGWNLSIESWEKGAAPTDMAKRRIEVGTTAPGPWRARAELEAVSGIGHYTTHLQIPARASGKLGARLHLGKIGGAARVAVNGGAPIAVNPFVNEVDLSGHLTPGTNRIEVIVATPLNNRLKAEGIENDMFAARPPGETPAEPAAPPPPPKLDFVPDEPAEQPPAMAKGAVAPGRPREVQDYGLIGPVELVFEVHVPLKAQG
ncbi:hypothetical protein HT136_20030 [Novosphingobium profundi]|uniref:glycosyl hydrolase n=1 Tax=Novosphingobium profundi TaxID=1774954 RepID=UPI001BDB49E7|nr:glycosyl hydrolase [Novosphingobium profundi]MBT0670660.1 hypothetical protein [Novosphingobium profundi]